MDKQLKDVLSSARKIAITAHISPDPDAIGSLSFLYQILKSNYPDKKIIMSVDDGFAKNLSFIKFSDKIKLQPLVKTIADQKPDLLIFLDGNEFKRFAKEDPEKLKAKITKAKIKTVIIDHHPIINKMGVDLYIQKETSSTAELIYEILNDIITLDRDSAEALLTSIVADTGRFLYPLRYPKSTFALVTECFKHGILIEELSNKMVRYTRSQLLIIAELLKNTVVTSDYTYSFYSREFLNNWFKETKGTKYEAGEANHSYVHTYLRAANGNKWGFTITPHTDNKKTFRVSFRADNAAGIDTSIFSKALGGGGHKPASGAEFEAKDIKEAIKKVKQIIKNC
ncbi:DHH family phosphoesterase [Candidatus Dojkabacteria bacterium]|nr:DHH family phosphoesterase [Candidatus Dojkabacteria bacterium]